MVRAVLAGFLIATATQRHAVVSWPALPATEFAAVALEKRGEAYELVDSLPVPGVARPAAVKLPVSSGAPFEVRDRDVAVRVKLIGQQAVAGVLKGDLLQFPASFQGADVTLRALSIGIEDFISLDGKRPPSVDYDVELEGIAGLRLHLGTLEFLTSDGNPRLRMNTPVVLSRKGPIAVAVSVQGCEADTSPRAPWNRPVTAPGAQHCTVHLGWELSPDGYPAILDPGWTTTANLNDRRSWQPTVTLSNGQVLVTGGFANGVTAGTFVQVSTTELYDPAQGTWTRVAGTTGPAVYNAPAIWIPAPIARAYVFGGGRAFGGLPPSAEVKAYDPIAMTWASVGTMLRGLELHTATYLPSNGKVLIVGGADTTGARVAAGEIFTPSLTLPNSTVAGPNMAGFGARCCHVAALLGSGKVLVSHGLDATTYNPTSMLYDPAANAVSSGGAVLFMREFPAASSLVDGRALITGGAMDVGGGTLVGRSTTEVFTEGTGFTTGPPMSVARFHHQQVRLTDNRILVAGGESPQNASTASTETWTPGALSWLNGGNLTVARREAGIALTGEGYVIVAGGGQGNAAVSTFVAVTSTESFELRPNGASCTGSGPCLSRNCVDGVCCDTACAGDCDACNISPSIGTCTPQPNTTLCRALAAGSLCDAVENCTGNTATCPTDAVAPATAICRGLQGTCDVVENCSGTTKTCGADVLAQRGAVCNTTFLCTGVDAGCPTMCTSNTDCVTGATCITGICTIQVTPGNSCTLNSQCTTNFCVGGVCCSSACTEACETCNLSGSVGTCRALAGGSPGDPSCSPYLCDGSARFCPGSCSNNSQCITGSACIAGTCQMVRTNVTMCTADAQCSSGFCTDGGCAPFACDGKSVFCPTSCAADGECGPSAVCVNKVCNSRTRGHVGFACAGCSSVDGASLLGLLGAVLGLRRRSKGTR